MVSARLNAMVSDEVERTYLGAIDGYWADLILAEFAFLEERGGTIKALSFHQKGDYVHYQGPWGWVIFDFMPDNFPSAWIDARADLRGSSTFEGSLDRLVGELASGTAIPSLARLDRETVEASVRRWADTLRIATYLF